MSGNAAVPDVVEGLHLGPEGRVALERALERQRAQRREEPGLSRPLHGQAELDAGLTCVQACFQPQGVRPDCPFAHRPPAQRPLLHHAHLPPLRLVYAQDGPHVQRPAHVHVIEPQTAERYLPAPRLPLPLHLGETIALEPEEDQPVVHLRGPLPRLGRCLTSSLPRHARIPAGRHLDLHERLRLPDPPGILHRREHLVPQRPPLTVSHLQALRQAGRMRQQHRRDLLPRVGQTVEHHGCRLRWLPYLAGQRRQRPPPLLPRRQYRGVGQLIQLVEVVLEEPLCRMGREEQRVLPQLVVLRGAVRSRGRGRPGRAIRSRERACPHAGIGRVMTRAPTRCQHLPQLRRHDLVVRHHPLPPQAMGARPSRVIAHVARVERAGDGGDPLAARFQGREELHRRREAHWGLLAPVPLVHEARHVNRRVAAVRGQRERVVRALADPQDAGR